MQEIQGHVTTESGVLGLIDHSHAALAEHLRDTIVRNSLSDHKEDPESMGLSYGVPAGKSTGTREMQHLRCITAFSEPTGDLRGRTSSILVAGISTSGPKDNFATKGTPKVHGKSEAVN